MFEKILFPIDFSLHSDTIVKCIPELKRAGMEEAILVHVINPTETVLWANVQETIADMKKNAEDKMEEIISEILSPPAGIKAKAMTAVGLPYQVILKIAEEDKASLIVMGSHGRSFMEGAILGSVTNSIIRQSKVPVLIAKLKFIEDKGEKKPVCLGMKNIFRKVLYPTDFSAYSRSVLQMIRHSEKAGIEEVVVVHIQDTTKLFPHLKHKMREFNEIDSERLEAIKNQLELAGYKAKNILKEGVPFVEINKIAEEEDVSLILLSSRGKSAVKEALMGSISESIARDHIRPVMIIPKNWKMVD
ncbi:MAG: universal stress protein [Deltaproteobacteria bacterium]|nr:universal stress protein [Deltaproteobacteria bacterium]